MLVKMFIAMFGYMFQARCSVRQISKMANGPCSVPTKRMLRSISILKLFNFLSTNAYYIVFYVCSLVTSHAEFISSSVAMKLRFSLWQ